MDETPAAPARRRSRPWWLLIGALGIIACGAILFSIVSPALRFFSGLPSTGESTASLPAATLAPSPGPVHTAAVAAATDPPPTAPPPTSPPVETPATQDPTPTTIPTITPFSTIVGVVITPTIVFGAETNFIQNGDFADNWVNGWTLETRGMEADIEVRRDSSNGPVLSMDKFGPGMTRLAQRVVLTFPVEGVTFRGDINLSGTSAGANEGRSALILRYEDANGVPLGASVWLDGSATATDLWGVAPLPLLGPTVSLRFADEGRQSLDLQLGRELTEELPDIDMVAVRQITILLALLGSDTCRPDDCRATLEAGRLAMTATAP